MKRRVRSIGSRSGPAVRYVPDLTATGGTLKPSAGSEMPRLVVDHAGESSITLRPSNDDSGEVGFCCESEQRQALQGERRPEIYRIILSRFACREFSDRPVMRRTISEIRSLARFAPSGANIQPWNVWGLPARLRGGFRPLFSKLTVTPGPSIIRSTSTMPTYCLHPITSGGRSLARSSMARLVSRRRMPRRVQTKRQELCLLRRSCRIDRHDRPSLRGGQLARSRHVRPEGAACGCRAGLSFVPPRRRLRSTTRSVPSSYRSRRSRWSYAGYRWVTPRSSQVRD